ncbi:MAG: diguanylate cyclase [Inquilinaceae bacterium]
MELSRLADGDYIYLYYGNAIARASKLNMTGRRSSDFTGELGDFFRFAYDKALEVGRPLYTVHRAEHAASVLIWERLIMPVRGADGDRLLIVYNKPLELRHAMLESIMEAVMEGILNLRAIRDADGVLEDFIITTANSAAGRIVGRAPEDLIDQRLLGVFPGLMASGLFDLYRHTAETGKPHQTETHYNLDGLDAWFRVNLVKTGDGVTVILADISEQKSQQRKMEQINRNLERQAAKLTEMVREREATQERLEREIEDRKRLEAELNLQAATDPLTALLNRRRFLEIAANELSRARRYERRLSVTMLDIDFFKAVNDTYGHAVGDTVLKAVAKVCAETVRGQDCLARLGGEEFAILTPETGAEGATILADRLREKIAAIQLGEEAPDLRVTASFGVTERIESDSAPEDLLRRADIALYAAKEAGRNRVMTEPTAAGQSGPRVQATVLSIPSAG